MGICLRPERCVSGPPIDITDAEFVVDVFRGLEAIILGVSVTMKRTCDGTEAVTFGIAVRRWTVLCAWLRATRDFGLDATELADLGWVSASRHEEVLDLLINLRTHCLAWNLFVDPDDADLLELVVDL